MRSKFFLCQCERCLDLDHVRGTKCPKCHSLVPCSYSADNKTATWACPKCGPAANITKTVVGTERQQILELERLVPRSASAPLSGLQSFLARCSQYLAPTHHVCIETRRILGRLHASKANQEDEYERMVGRSAGPEKYIHRIQSAQHIVKVMSLLECSAVGCLGCDLANRHDPVYDVECEMFHAGMDLTVVPLDMELPIELVEAVGRYLPILKGKFGEDDTDVRAIEARLRSAHDKCLLFNSPGGSSELSHQCSYCGMTPINDRRLKRCRKCQAAYYCNRDCQQKHWKSGHKDQCDGNASAPAGGRTQKNKTNKKR